MPKKVIMNQEDIRRTLARIAHEMIERNKAIERLILVGMHTRGVPLANRLAANIEDFVSTKVPVGTLDISFYRDDLSSLELQPTVKNTDIPVSVDDKTIVLIDDVLYTGRSIRAAWMPSLTWGDPS